MEGNTLDIPPDLPLYAIISSEIPVFKKRIGIKRVRLAESGVNSRSNGLLAKALRVVDGISCFVTA